MFMFEMIKLTLSTQDKRWDFLGILVVEGAIYVNFVRLGSFFFFLVKV